MGRALVVVMLVISGCGYEQTNISCDDNIICPTEMMCAPTGGGCVDPINVKACEGVAENGECELDGGARGACHAQVCTPVSCGNALIDPGEACDDGNTVDGDGCSRDCRRLR